MAHPFSHPSLSGPATKKRTFFAASLNNLKKPKNRKKLKRIRWLNHPPALLPSLVVIISTLRWRHPFQLSNFIQPVDNIILGRMIYFLVRGWFCYFPYIKYLRLEGPLHWNKSVFLSLWSQYFAKTLWPKKILHKILLSGWHDRFFLTDAECNFSAPGWCRTRKNWQ